jgi:transcriptional antiterminator Rof (Rho-off)
MHWVGEGTNSMHYEKINCSDFHTLYILCAYNTTLLVMREISKDGIGFQNYIFRFSSKEITKF